MNTETFPEEMREVMMKYEAFDKPTALMVANERRAQALHTYETHMLNKVSPAVTTAYRSRKEALPHEQVRTSFVEQPFRVRGTIRNNMGSKDRFIDAKRRSRAQQYIYE